ncbi:MAG: MFS transporter, partial [Acidimicrobiales bacterium]
MTVNDPVGIGKAEVLGAVALDAPVARHRGLGRQFTQLWCGFAIANAVDGLAYGALPLLGLFVDRRPLAVAAVAASATLPWLLVALPAGALVDRYERGRVMAFSNLARGVVLAILTALIVMHHLNIELLVLLSLAVASARVVYYSASQAALKDILPKSALSRGNGVLTGTEAGAEHLGGPIVGSVAFVASRMLPFLADAVMMVVSGLWLFGLRTGVLRPSNEPSVEPEEMTRAEPAAGEKTGMLEGIRF